MILFRDWQTQKKWNNRFHFLYRRMIVNANVVMGETTAVVVVSGGEVYLPTNTRRVESGRNED